MRERIKDFVAYRLPSFFVSLNYWKTGIKWSGDYSSWEDARAASDGYESEIIFERVKEAVTKVRNGQAAYERDSVLFYKPRYSWPLLAGLLRAACQNKNRLCVLDFGGSLGSTYFQNRAFLSHLDEIRWCIVEQRAFVEYGRREVENEQLRFYEDLQTCYNNERINICLLSSVLPYLENPYELLDEVFSLNIRHIIVERTPFLTSGDRDRLTVQKVSSRIYPASYPAWFFSEQKFLKFIGKQYRIIASYDCDDRASIPCKYKGFILEKIEK